MELIAKEAGAAKATVYAYFRRKEDVFYAVSVDVLKKLLADATATRERTRPGKERLIAILTEKHGTVFELVHQSPHARELLDSSDVIVREPLKDCHERFMVILAEVLAETRGARRRSAADRELAEILDAACEGIAGRAASRKQLDLEIGRLIDMVVAGMP